VSTLVVWVLLATGPVRYDTAVDSCTAGGQIALAGWMALHPEHRGQRLRWTCDLGVPS
jgi:hypothetical protein